MPYIEITHNVDTEQETYPDFIGNLRGILADHGEQPYIRNHDDGSVRHVLPRQNNGRAPRRWIYIKLVLSDGAETTLAVRDDNVYLIGFKNRRGEWFEFGFSGTINDPATRNQSMPMLQERSRFLECDFNYGSLLRGGARSFVGMKLGLEFAHFAVRQLSGYTQGQGGKVDKRTRRALAGLMAMVCEATRMRPFQRAGWDHPNCYCIRSEHVDYIWGWGDMSEALLRWDRSPDKYEFPPCLRDIGVQRACHAFAIVELILNTNIDHDPRWRLDRWRQRPAAGDEDDARRSEQHQRRAAAGGPSETQQPASGEHASGSGQQPSNKKRRTEQQHHHHHQQPSDHQQEQDETPGSPADDYVARGRPLAEVFAVRAAFPFVGTIAVFDGMRGQVIYDGRALTPGSSSTSGDALPLLLTGPYRAISAYGSFTIEVHISGGAARSTTNVVGELNWDCYDEKKVYDRPVTETITTTIGREVQVTYAVLTAAVDAELQVHLRHLPGATTADSRGAVFYGRIATRSKAFHDQDLAWSVLFDSGVEGVSLVAADDDGSGSIARLPLARSVVAMPLGSPLVIVATLYDAPPSQHGVTPVFQCQDMELTLEDRKKSHFADNGGEFEVSITSPDYYPRPRRNDTATPRRAPTNHYAGCY